MLLRSNKTCPFMVKRLKPSRTLEAGKDLWFVHMNGSGHPVTLPLPQLRLCRTSKSPEHSSEPPHECHRTQNSCQGVPRTHATANLHMTKERFGANDCIPTSPCQSEAGEWRTDYMNPKTKTPQQPGLSGFFHTPIF